MHNWLKGDGRPCFLRPYLFFNRYSNGSSSIDSRSIRSIITHDTTSVSTATAPTTTTIHRHQFLGLGGRGGSSGS